ncbi:DUF928 domain-containing protein [Mastigocoleus testarum]|uniref:DUF928 domain-containing protein n=1 Tax=Mastigocoleus testarum BC008 TaxID=371196 RepID=A0A0V7ZYF5_9CYAN|nr:DUF928 domain-containing protein [Mastigocoleus testarum]KST69393.1 hypothetical protein BC008_35305 [Mastigocoleus testarum BC008]
MKLIWLLIKFSLVFTLSSTTLISYFLIQDNSAYSSNKGSKKIKFLLPAPPPGKPVGGRTRGGGSRGPCLGAENTLTALVPSRKHTLNSVGIEEENVWGLTTSDRAVFHFYVPYSNKNSFHTEFLLRNEESRKIVYLSEIPLPSKPGIISVSLPETVKPLEMNKNYRWYFNIYCKPQRPFPSLTVEGVVRRVKLSEELTKKINAAEPHKQIEIYAAEGIWFNALDILAELRKKEPENKELIENWKSLLGSVGMDDISESSLVEY